MERLAEYSQKICDLNDEIEQYLVQFVKKHNSFIDTSDDEYSTTIYGFIFDEEFQSVFERKIDGIKVEDDVLYILVNDEWYVVIGGYVVTNATLYNICEGLPEYVEDD